MTLFLAFLGVSALVIATPGPDTAITVRNTLAGGRIGGVATAFGIACGQLVWAVATSAGIVALLVASEPVFLAVKYVGAGYLVYLGLVSLRQAIRPSADGAAAPRPLVRASRRLGARSAFGQGLLSDLANPKMAVFFASLLPQFAPGGTGGTGGTGGGASFLALLGLGIVFSAMTFGWLSLYAVILARAGDVLRRPRIRRAIEAVTGTLLVGLGLRIATEHR